VSLLAILIGQFGLPEAALWVVRVIAAVGGAFVGWFVTDPLARITYRLAAQKPIPPRSLPWLKVGGAATLALLMYLIVSLGGGPSGLGFGPGLGGGPGKGVGDGGKDTGKVVQDGKNHDKKNVADIREKTTDKPPAPIVRKPVEIEVLGGDRYPGYERYYLLRSTGKALNLKEVEAYFKENADRIELHVVLTDDSPAKGLGIREDLTGCANRYFIPSLMLPPNQKKQP
jgi:hypothetical protein